MIAKIGFSKKEIEFAKRYNIASIKTWLMPRFQLRPGKPWNRKMEAIKTSRFLKDEKL